MTPPEDSIGTALRNHAEGSRSLAAAAELLIAQAWLDRDDFAGRFVAVCPGPGPGNGKPIAVIDWPAAIRALDTSMPSSGGEKRMLRITASLADGIPVDLRDTLTGLDDRNIQLVITAIRHASGKTTDQQILTILISSENVEPRDGAQPPGHGRPAPALSFQLAGEGLDVGAADGEQRQGAGAAPAAELAQVERVGLAGQAAVPGQVPGEREPLGVGEGRLDGDESGRWNRGGHRDTSADSQDLQGWAQVPAMNDDRNVRRALKTSHTTIRSQRTIPTMTRTHSRSPILGRLG